VGAYVTRSAKHWVGAGYDTLTSQDAASMRVNDITGVTVYYVAGNRMVRGFTLRDILHIQGARDNSFSDWDASRLFDAGCTVHVPAVDSSKKEWDDRRHV
jgi:hypothetical protein